MSNSPTIAAYARETALCVDLAYDAMAEDIAAELARPGGPDKHSLKRILDKLNARRGAIAHLIKIPKAA